MSLYDKASIALIPSGYKASTLYSVMPANGNGDFTHSRSNTTSTRVNKDGLIEDVTSNIPRLDYPLTNGLVGDCPQLLLEPSRTNLVQRSEEFDNSYWSKSLSSVTANQAISPDGTQTADALTKNADFGAISRAGISISSGSNYTLSIFVKKSTTNFFSLRQASGSYDVRKQFNLTTKEVSNGSGANQTGFVSSKIEEYPNDWYRLSIVCTSNGTSLTVSFYSGKVGESTNNGDSFIWGAQVEAGSYPTSYIPTSGTSVTRSADACNSSGTSAEFNGSEGVLFVEFEAFENGNSTRVISISDGSTNNNVYINTKNTENTFTAQIIVNGSTGGFSLSTTNVNQTNNNKIAVKYKTNDHAMWVNGTEVATNNTHSTANMATLDRLNFDFGQGSSDYYGKIKQVIYFDEALTDDELQTLTS